MKHSQMVFHISPIVCKNNYKESNGISVDFIMLYFMAFPQNVTYVM